MTGAIKDILAQQAAETFVGRSKEMVILLQSVSPTGPLVTAVHGVAGIGKSRLLEAFSRQARDRGATVVGLDCRTMEPTDRGFLHELTAAIGADEPTIEATTHRLALVGTRVVLALDNYEVFRLLDTWLRQVMIPALPDNTRVILAGREAPVAAWFTSPGWQGMICSVPLGPLADGDAIALLSRAAIGPEQARRINRFTHGHPLALTLAAAAASESGDAGVEERAEQRVVEELTRLYLAEIDDPLTRRAIDAASVVRRTTLSLLAAMLPDLAPHDAYQRLSALPFVDGSSDGLHLHDSVQQAIASALRAGDPSSYRNYRRAAWHRLRTEVSAAGQSELWRYTADMLYLIENPVVREAFFPTSSYFGVEPARPEDHQSIQDITSRHDEPPAASLLEHWWTQLPQSFFVVRDDHGEPVGFNCVFDPATVSQPFLRADPITRAWIEHLRRDPVPKGQRVLFYRRWLSRDHGEGLSAIQAACWLDIKRMYMEQRPHLRRLYATLLDLPTLGPTFAKLRFQVLPDAQVTIGESTYYTGMLDFGPGSVDQWLAALAAGDLGIEQDELLDMDSRELVLDGKRVALTPLEFGVMEQLQRHEGKAVSRSAMLAEVWGYEYQGGSNVVDVVVRSLRKKLAERASLIETVSGTGYRFRGE